VAKPVTALNNMVPGLDDDNYAVRQETIVLFLSAYSTKAIIIQGF
jgi:hypothetical protein